MSAKAWTTKSVRAYNLKKGDVLDCYDSKRRRAVKLTVQWVDPQNALDDLVHVGFRRRAFGWKLKRMQIIRVRRLIAA